MFDFSSSFFSFVGNEAFSNFKFKIEPSDTIAVRGNPAHLDCVAEGSPKPTIEWKRDGMFLSLDSQSQR